MMVDSLLNYTPDGKLTVFKSGLFGGQSELQLLTLQVCVSGGVRGSTVLLQ